MNILLCFGTRPEAIKLAPIIQELKNQNIDFTVCVTAQHREMLDQVLDFFDIVPDFDLDLMKPGQGLNLLSGLILREMDDLLEKIDPDIILVQGDTTTAFICSLAAFNRGIKIGHIEAGLRTGNLKSPFPEEANRQLISRIADLHFVPTLSAKNNLLLESIPEHKIITTGNTVIDALLLGKTKLEQGYLNEEIRTLKAIREENKKLVLVTGHRRENLGNGIEKVCKALLQIVHRRDVQIIFPVHLNPSVKEAVHKWLGNIPDISLIDPVSYPAVLWLMMKADLIITDSGGIQEEAPSFRKPVIVFRDTTERPEGVEDGFSFLTGTSPEKIVSNAFRLLDAPPDYSKKKNPFGDGKAAEFIVKHLFNGPDFKKKV